MRPIRGGEGGKRDGISQLVCEAESCTLVVQYTPLPFSLLTMSGNTHVHSFLLLFFSPEEKEEEEEEGHLVPKLRRLRPYLDAAKRRRRGEEGERGKKNYFSSFPSAFLRYLDGGGGGREP